MDNRIGSKLSLIERNMLSFGDPCKILMGMMVVILLGILKKSEFFGRICNPRLK